MEYLNTLKKNLRILEVREDSIIAASGYSLREIVNGDVIAFSKIHDPISSFLSRIRLASRLFRIEVYQYRTMQNDLGICIAKKGIFIENKNNGRFEKVFHIERGSRPMSLCEDRDGDLYFGEYFDNKTRDKVNVYASFNMGIDWEIVYSFPSNTIRHIHTIDLDPYTGVLWISTGDENGECIIAISKDKFNTIEIIAQGGQNYRTCKFLFLEDDVIYGTDSPYMENFITIINRRDLTFSQIQKVQGSVINSCQIGSRCFISTTVEPSKINMSRYSYLWYSENGREWVQIAHYKKDIFNATLFQYGNIRFPHYQTNCTKSLFFSGHSLKKIDGHSVEVFIP